MHSDLHIRRARPSDQKQLSTLWMAFMSEQTEADERVAVAEDALTRWNNDYPVWIEDETIRLFVAESQGDIVGWAFAERWGPPPVYEPSDEVYLNELYVHPKARRQGAGAKLVQAVRTWATALGARRIRLSVLTQNETGRAFWAEQQARSFSETRTVELDPSPTSPDQDSQPFGFR